MAAGFFTTPWTVAARFLCIWDLFPRQEYWSGLPFPPLKDLLDPWTEPESLAMAGGFFTTEPPGKPTGKIPLLINEGINSSC